MLILPVELQRHCVQHLDIKTLKSFRTVNKAVLPLSTEALFHTIALFPGEESSTKFAHVLENSNLNPLVRKVIFETSSSADKKRDSESEKEIDKDFVGALCTVGQFSNLCEVELRFSAECALHDKGSAFDKYVQESVSFRTRILEELFKALNNPNHPTLKLDGLVINNLQDHTPIYDNDDFVAVRSRLKKLALNIATETNEYSPERDIDMAAIHKMFNDDLLEHWLKPLQDQLTHLTIYCDAYWGVWPRCDLRTVHFPQLKSLTLGNFSIVHDWQVDWILSHGSTLEELHFDDCPITIALRLFPEQCRANFPELMTDTDDRDPEDLREYIKDDVSLRWHDVLPRFQARLPHLKSFVMGRGNWDWGLHFLERHELGSKMGLYRYNIFTAGSGPSSWNDFEDYDGERVFEGWEEIKFPDCDERDFEALVELLEVVNVRNRG
jgi:hypothetical protein